MSAQVPRNVTPFMGYTVRVEDYRYTAWISFDGTRNRGNWEEAAADTNRSHELYDVSSCIPSAEDYIEECP